MRRRSSGSAAEQEGDDSPAITELIQGPAFTARILNGDSLKFQSTSRQTSPQHSQSELDRRKSSDQRPPTARSRRPSNTNWKPTESRNGQIDKGRPTESTVISVSSKGAIEADKMADSRQVSRRSRLRSPWSFTPLTLGTTIIALLALASIIHSFTTRQLDNKGCRMSYMRPSFAKLSDFDTEHTRFASKYSVYLYREGMVDEDTKVWWECVESEIPNLRTLSRSKVSPFYSYLEMLGVINKFDQLRRRQQHTFTMFYNTILLRSMPELGIWTSLRSISMRI